MSRVAKKPIMTNTSGVNFEFTGQKITVSSSKASLAHEVHPSVCIKHTDDALTFEPVEHSDNWALAGTTRALVANMLIGVTTGYTKELELVGVGYRVKLEGRSLHFNLGYSHPIVYELPESIQASIEKQVTLTLTSHDKQALGQCAANIVSLRKPDAYKGKGVRYKHVPLKLKEVKKK